MAKNPKISKETAQRAKDTARKEKQAIMGQARKNLTTQDKMRIASLNEVIESADSIINEEE